jgi:hypothetical protein
MVYSMLALLVPIALMLMLYRFLGGESPTVINAAPAFADARTRAAYQVLKPTPVPGGWWASTAQSGKDGGYMVLRVGYAGPEGAFLQLTESDAPTADVVSQAAGANASAAEKVEVGGKPWQWYTGAKNSRALVLSEPGRTIVLAGRAPEATLTGFATALR